MSDILRERIQSRLKELDINPFEAARRANFERSYVNDLLIGKKSTMRQTKVSELARALDCDPNYLLGYQAAPRSGGRVATQGGGLPLKGIAEAFAWRKRIDFATRRWLPVSPDPRYSAPEQGAYLVQGDHAAGLGITDGSVLIVYWDAKTFRDGDVVIVVETRTVGDDPEYRYTVRMVSNGKLVAKPAEGHPDLEPIPMTDAKIAGLVVSAHKIFGN